MLALIWFQTKFGKLLKSHLYTLPLLRKKCLSTPNFDRIFFFRSAGTPKKFQLLKTLNYNQAKSQTFFLMQDPQTRSASFSLVV